MKTCTLSCWKIKGEHFCSLPGKTVESAYHPQMYSLSRKAKLFPKLWKPNGPISDLPSLSVVFCVSHCHLPSGDKVSLLWSSLQSALHCEKNREWLPTFCLITICNFLHLLEELTIGHHHIQFPNVAIFTCYYL